MVENNDEVHVETDGARGGSTPNIVRWILIVSLVLAIVLLSITWITGALSMGEQGSEATATDRLADQSGEQADGTDSIVSDNADAIEAAPSDEQPGMVENQAGTEQN